MDDEQKRLVSSAAVRRRYGSLSAMSLYRWMTDPRLSFPKAIKIRERNFFYVHELDEFDRRMADAGRRSARTDKAVELLRTKAGLLLIDGRNRLEAMERVGLTVIKDGKLTVRPKVIDDRDGFDAKAYVISANIRRRHLTTQKKRALLRELFNEN